MSKECCGTNKSKPVGSNEFTDSLIGMNKDEAITKIKEAKLAPCFNEDADQPCHLTCDFRDDRVNIYFKDGKVTEAYIG